MRILVQFGSKLGSQKVPTMGLAGLRETHSRAFGSTQQAKERYPYLKRQSSTTLGGTPAYCWRRARHRGGPKRMLRPREDEAAPKRRFRSSKAFANPSPQLSKSFPKPYAKPSQEPQHSPRRTQNTQGSQETPQRQPGALQGCPRSPPKASKRASKSLPKSFQMLPNPSPNPPKPCQNPPKIEPKSIQKASWSLSWINALKKLAFERPKNGQEGPKSAQETPQTLPDPPQMEPKTFPNPIFR